MPCSPLPESRIAIAIGYRTSTPELVACLFDFMHVVKSSRVETQLVIPEAAQSTHARPAILQQTPKCARATGQQRHGT